ncbi:hypothetical protein D9601_09410 [Sphingomonas sp. MA1305]|nr:hypothetical protein [Sphingomonas sp. MA1305]
MDLMNDASVVERFNCAERIPRHRFQINDWDLSIQELTTGLRPSITYLRDYTKFAISSEDGRNIFSSCCSWRMGDLTSEEEKRYADLDIVAAITWSTGWSTLFESKRPHAGLTKDFIIDFFHFYKRIVGKGKRVGDSWKDILVYVELSRND